MGILDLPKTLLGKAISKGAIFSAVGGYAADRIMERSRKRWQTAKNQSFESLLEQITAYDIGRGAGKLLAGWLEFSQSDNSLDAQEIQLQQLLQIMDPDDTLVEDLARSRFIVSKALFRLEGFKLSHCRYETYQNSALALLQKNPKYKKLTRNDLFKGTPFPPEDLIATTHRMLLTLEDGDGRLTEYIQTAVLPAKLRDDTDYMARLIAMTLGAEEEALATAMAEWFEAYCDFKITQTHERQSMINTSITTATGGLPASLGMDLLGRVGKAVFSKRK